MTPAPSSPHAPRLTPARLAPLLLTLAIGVALWFTPPPEGVSLRAWHLLAIYVGTIAGIMLKPAPGGVVTLCGMLAATLTGVLSIDQALGAFSNKTIWLIVLAFFIARGFIKTGLGARIGYQLISLLGQRTLGLAYGLSATDLILAPAMPSNTARAAGVVYPLVLAVSHAYDSKPDAATHRRMGAFLMLNSFQATLITGAMFLTAMAANLIAQQMAADQGITITWTGWALAAFPPGVASILLVPLVLYWLYPPTVRETPEARELAREKLQQMGPMKQAEWVVLSVFLLVLTLWVVGPELKLDSTVAALTGLVLLLLSGALTWEDIVSERGAWETLIWFSVLVMLAENLGKLGLIGWFSAQMQEQLGGIDWLVAFPALVLIYYYSHYFFASNTAHVSAMYGAFLGVAVGAGTPPLLAALVLGFSSNLFSSITHYSTGPAPVFFGAGYVSVGTWWSVGLVVSVVNLLIWGVLGGLWWKVLGLW